MSAVTLAPTAFARDNPCGTALCANSEPSVGISRCRYMYSSLHLYACRHCASIDRRNVGVQKNCLALRCVDDTSISLASVPSCRGRLPHPERPLPPQLPATAKKLECV